MKQDQDTYRPETYLKKIRTAVYLLIPLFIEAHCSQNRLTSGLRRTGDELLQYGKITRTMENLPHIEYIHLGDNAVVTQCAFLYSAGENSSSVLDLAEGGSGSNYLKLLLLSESGLLSYDYQIYGYHKTLPIRYHQRTFGTREPFDQLLSQRRLGRFVGDAPEEYIEFGNNVIVTYAEFNYTSGDARSSNVDVEKRSSSALRLLLSSESDYVNVEYTVYGLELNLAPL